MSVEIIASRKTLLLYLSSLIVSSIYIWICFSRFHFLENYITLWDESHGLLTASNIAHHLRDFEIIPALRISISTLNHPFLYYFFYGIVFTVFGANALSLKIAGYVLIISIISFVFLICHKLDSKRAGWLGFIISILTIHSAAAIFMPLSPSSNITVFPSIYFSIYCILLWDGKRQSEKWYLYSLLLGLSFAIVFLFRYSAGTLVIFGFFGYIIYKIVIDKKVSKRDVTDIIVVFAPLIVIISIYITIPPSQSRLLALWKYSGLSVISSMFGIDKYEELDFYLKMHQRPTLYYIWLMPSAYVGSYISSVIAAIAISLSVFNYRNRKLTLLVIILVVFITIPTASKRFSLKYMTFISPLIYLTVFYSGLCLYDRLKKYSLRIKYAAGAILVAFTVPVLLNFNNNLQNTRILWLRDFAKIKHIFTNEKRTELFERKAPYSILRKCLVSMAEMVEGDSNVLMIGNVNEFSPFLMEWYLSQYAGKPIKVTKVSYTGKLLYNYWPVTDWQEMYKKKLVRLLEGSRYDYLVTFKVEDDSAFDTFDYHYNLKWQNNYINLLDDKSRLYLNDFELIENISKDGIVFKVYRHI